MRKRCFSVVRTLGYVVWICGVCVASVWCDDADLVVEANSSLVEKKKGVKDVRLLDATREKCTLLPQSPIDSVDPGIGELFNQRCSSGCNLGVIYFPSSGGQRGIVMDVSGLWTTVRYSWQYGDFDESMSLLDALKTQMLRGYILKESQGFCVEDNAVLRQPYMRQSACRRTRFLCEFLRTVLKDLLLPQLTAGSVFHGVQGSLQRLQGQDCVESGSYLNVAWSILEQEELEGGVCARNTPQGTTIFLLKGETVALCGTPLDLEEEIVPVGKSLFDYVALKALGGENVLEYAA